jgi:hypothetical protein
VPPFVGQIHSIAPTAATASRVTREAATETAESVALWAPTVPPGLVVGPDGVVGLDGVRVSGVRTGSSGMMGSRSSGSMGANESSGDSGDS